MVINVTAQGHLRHFRQGSGAVFAVELPANARVLDLIHASTIPWEEIGLVAVNGQQAGDNSPLADGDQVMLMAPMEGG